MQVLQFLEHRSTFLLPKIREISSHNKTTLPSLITLPKTFFSTTTNPNQNQKPKSKSKYNPDRFPLQPSLPPGASKISDEEMEGVRTGSRVKTEYRRREKKRRERRRRREELAFDRMRKRPMFRSKPQYREYGTKKLIFARRFAKLKKKFEKSHFSARTFKSSFPCHIRDI